MQIRMDLILFFLLFQHFSLKLRVCLGVRYGNNIYIFCLTILIVQAMISCSSCADPCMYLRLVRGE